MSPVPTNSVAPGPKSAVEMDEERREQVAYEYLCRLEEAKKWVEHCIDEEVAPTTELEESLRNGVYLAKLAHFFAPAVVAARKIFDADLAKYAAQGLHFRHTDNINYFLQAIRHIGLPEVFTPETTDVYDRKNMPRVVFCLHALSLFLYKLGIAPPMDDLYGKAEFTAEEIGAMRRALDECGVRDMPAFRKIGGILASEMPVDEAALHAAIIAVNEALDHDAEDNAARALKNPAACLADINQSLVKKYHIVLRNAKLEKRCNNQYANGNMSATLADAYDELLTRDEIQEHVDKVNLLVALEAVEDAVAAGDPRRAVVALNGVPGLRAPVRAASAEAYLAELTMAVQSLDEDFLRTEMIEEIVARVNKLGKRRSLTVTDPKIIAVKGVNDALKTGDSSQTVRALANPALGLEQLIVPNGAPLYHTELDYIRRESRADLRFEGIVGLAEFLSVIARINEAAALGCDVALVWKRLTHPEANVEDLDPDYIEEYGNRIIRAFRLKENHPTCDLLTHSEIQDAVDQVNAEQQSANVRAIPEQAVVNFQAAARGFLERRRLFLTLQHYSDNVERVVRAQSAWRGALARRRFRRTVTEAAEADRARRPLLCWPASHYRRHERQAVAIQRAWRAFRQRREFESLMRAETMTLSVVRKYLHLLDMRAEDFDQELLLQTLKGDITKLIRQNQHLEKDLDAMDIKIGLLVKNRISVQDVVAHGKRMNMRRSGSSGLQRKDTFYAGVANSNSGGVGGDPAGDPRGAAGTLQRNGLKALRKESREKLDAYQRLFYLLQTSPVYLAKLVFAMPQTKTTKFMESVIFTLYNFGANQREEFLLLKLFRTALEEEVTSKVDRLTDVVTGQPMVVKMIVSFNRSGKGQDCLRELLGPLVNRVLEDKTLHISTNPVEIYKQWLNQLETDSGKTAGMPYDVTVAQALEYDEVQKRFNRSLTRLKQVSTLFLTTILKSKTKLPYNILYMAKVLYNALSKKFPSAPEKEVLKVIGNLIYYRYLNSAIVAPDSCDIVDVNSGEKALNNEQRKNLGSVAKVLQFAASKKGFGDESPHLQCLNQYIIESHEKLKVFFRECCQSVREPEDEFCMDHYYEATLIAKPVIYISLAEICDTHQLLLDYRYQIAPDERDCLHELLDDLGGEPSLCSLLGATATVGNTANPNSSSSSLSHLGATEVCLTLMSKFELESEDVGMAEKLFVKSKHLIMTVLPCTREANLLGCLKSRTTPDQAEYYWRLVERREAADARAENNRTMLDHTNVFLDDEVRLPLDDTKKHILKNLQVLERHGYVTNKDGCQAIINSLGKDIVNQKQYRTRRRREVFRLKNTLGSLASKREFYESQVEYYNEYLKTCLANLHGKAEERGASKRVRFHSRIGGGGSRGRTSASSLGSTRGHSELKSRQSVRYSGSKLHSKGVLLSIEGLPSNQLKNVLFEFVPKEGEDGVFEVHARFMGVRLEHVELDIQELLQLQYEGVAVMNMFGKARINVNLLLHLVNVKFYGSSKNSRKQ